MLKPEQVPYDVVRAAYAAWAGGGGNNVLSAMEQAIAAAINAWPRMTHNPAIEQYGVMQRPYLILPLNTENPDAEA